MSKNIYLLFAVLLWNINPSSAQTKEEVMNKLKHGLGGETALDEAHFLMFSCKPLQQTETIGLHHYLYNLESGDVRFEALTKDDEVVIALFNSKTKKGTVFIDNKEEKDQQPLSRIIDFFEDDSYWILSPILLGDNKASAKIGDSQIRNSKRYFTLNAEFPNSPFSRNTIFVDATSGLISYWETFDKEKIKKNDFICSNHRDIGGGLKLPTKFTDIQRGSTVQYPVIAALVNTELIKFKIP
ncbi:MAG TPA: hypothetical protein VKZ95_08980 [Sphingobacteriaceae bacterium]|nr:hypothetical protein [Sphingobacteriaceae bacterium]